VRTLRGAWHCLGSGRVAGLPGTSGDGANGPPHNFGHTDGAYGSAISF
jgi:hypothetical protein